MIEGLLLGSFGALPAWAFVIWAVRRGSYPSHGQTISRTDRPITFWTVMTIIAAFGAIFLLGAVIAGQAGLVATKKGLHSQSE